MHAALKLPHAAASIELEAQHCAPPAHCDGCTEGSHDAPRASVPAAAVGAEEDVPVGVADVDADPVTDEDSNSPLQKPWLHLLNAHCWSLVHSAWKLPQAGCSMELVA